MKWTDSLEIPSILIATKENYKPLWENSAKSRGFWTGFTEVIFKLRPEEVGFDQSDRITP